MNKSNEFMKSYKTLELHVHATIDDAMHKVTQEVGEMLEAHDVNDIVETQKEAWDVIVNILSVATELWCDIEIQESESKRKTPTELVVMLGEWNAKVQGFRNRYSREDVNLDELNLITSQFISEIMKYIRENISLDEIIWNNIEKFASRLSDYKPDTDISDYVDTYNNFPIEGIEFKDISPILRDPKAFRYVCFELAKLCHWADRIAWLDARWFLFGPRVAEILWIPFEMIRKKGKLPGACVGTQYDLEYGSNAIEIQKLWIQSGEKIAILDDLLATWWTVGAAIKLIELLGAEVIQTAFLIALDHEDISSLPSRRSLSDYTVDSIISYD